MDLFEIIRTHQVIFVFILGMLFTTLGWAFVTRVRQVVDALIQALRGDLEKQATTFRLALDERAKAVDLVSVGSHVTSMEARVVGLEQAVKDMPTTTQMREIAVALADIRGELKAGTERFRGLEDMIKIQREEVQQIDEYLRRKSMI